MSKRESPKRVLALSRGGLRRAKPSSVQAGEGEATPAALGFRMPAEWEPHAATWLAWPHEPRDWPGKLAPIPWVYGEVVRTLTRGERVRILTHDVPVERRARALLA